MTNSPTKEEMANFLEEIRRASQETQELMKLSNKSNIDILQQSQFENKKMVDGLKEKVVYEEIRAQNLEELSTLRKQYAELEGLINKANFQFDQARNENNSLKESLVELKNENAGSKEEIKSIKLEKDELQRKLDQTNRDFTQQRLERAQEISILQGENKSLLEKTQDLQQKLSLLEEKIESNVHLKGELEGIIQTL